MNKMKLGLSKYAQMGQDEEFVDPEERAQETVITCMSDCMYAQNPEKTCMLKNVSLAMSEAGQFTCGQYAPSQQAQAPGMAQSQPQQAQPAAKAAPAQKPAAKPAPAKKPEVKTATK